MAYPTLKPDAEQHRRALVANAIYQQKNAARYADHASRARDEGFIFYAIEYQRIAASHARGAQNCLSELLGLPRDYDGAYAS